MAANHTWFTALSQCIPYIKKPSISIRDYYFGYATAQLVIARSSLTMLATAEKPLTYHANNSLSKKIIEKSKKLAFFTK